MKSYLEFERNIKVLEEELEKLKDPFNKEGISEVDTQRISEIQMEINEKLKLSDFSKMFEFFRFVFPPKCFPSSQDVIPHTPR